MTKYVCVADLCVYACQLSGKTRLLNWYITFKKVFFVCVSAFVRDEM